MSKIQTIRRVTDRLLTGMGLTCGVLFLALGFFITIDVLGRKSGLFGTRVTDEIGGYFLALAGSWGLAYALRMDAHVRIDVLLPHMPRRLRAFMDFLAMAFMALFAFLISAKLWQMVSQSIEYKSTSNSYLLAPLWIPQSLLALGFSALAFTAVFTLVLTWAEGLLELAQSIRFSRKEGQVAPVSSTPLSTAPAASADPPSEPQR